MNSMDTDTTQQLKSAIEEFVKKLCDALSLSARTEFIEESDVLRVNIDIEDPGLLIGYRGETLYMIQHIARVIATKKGESPAHIVIDVNQYRAQRARFLEELARNTADQVRFAQKPIELEPMSAYDRRIVHTVLSQRPDIITESQGEGEERRVVVKPNLTI